MKLQLQPSRWSCIPTAISMVLDIPVAQIFRDLGHDGSQILWPNQPEPLRRKGFHIEEMQYVCRLYGVVLAPFVFRIEYAPNLIGAIRLGDTHLIEFSKFHDVLAEYQGVLLGRYPGGGNHAVAWDATRIYDPAGTSGQNFGIETFYAAIRNVGSRDPGWQSARASEDGGDSFRPP